jgi:hypothetical protein
MLNRFSMIHFRTQIASNVWMAVLGFIAGLTVMVLTTYATDAPDPKDLKGLTYSYAARVERSCAWYRTPEFYGVVVITMFLFLNFRFF